MIRALLIGILSGLVGLFLFSIVTFGCQHPNFEKIIAISAGVALGSFVMALFFKGK